MVEKTALPELKISVDESSLPIGYKPILDEVRGKIKDAQLRVVTAVNKELVTVYWDI